MIHFLARKLIRHYNNVSDAAVRRAYGVLCGAVLCFSISRSR